MLSSKLSKVCLGTALSFALVLPSYALAVTGVSAAQTKGIALAPAKVSTTKVNAAVAARYKMAGFRTIVGGKTTGLGALIPRKATPKAAAVGKVTVTRGVLNFRKR
ncbi:Uncharacterised protein [Legionella steigerwaltii]|uniref:PASTA domain-containing protein n=1 Tax=Legionella steigerwaltii TaxID=460 RepID=A0A378L4B6_9GAMM|nr:hypothetical protein [Legionella steigerwaltii]KTD75379.1 hypothetical protein Lstg_2474 [Legionella steigerwaltii]STY21527.1 Uncharacterised protein [Legionella steigerwaltii]